MFKLEARFISPFTGDAGPWFVWCEEDGETEMLFETEGQLSNYLEFIQQHFPNFEFSPVTV